MHLFIRTFKTRHIMDSYIISGLILFAVFCTASIIHLSARLRKDRKMLALVGLFCMAMGSILLVLDLLLIAFTHGPEFIPDYLLFNRLVSDTGFAGRWALTAYLFLISGPAISIYLLAGDTIKKFNKAAHK